MAKEDLYSNLEKLVKQANRRIYNIEKLTGIKEGFASKDLLDYLESPIYNFKTKKGRIRFSKQYTDEEAEILQDAISNFLKQESSTIKGIKQIKLKYEADIFKETGKEKKLTYNQSNVIYRTNKDYTWIYDFVDPSDFWGYFVTAKEQMNWNKETWISKLKDVIKMQDSGIPDKQLETDLEALFYYVGG